jgi:cysteine-rich repeat protein
VAIDVAPLTLPLVTGAIYDVLIEYDDGGAWSPVVTLDDRGGDADGSLTYISPCVAGVDNRVTVTLIDVLGPGGAPLTDVALPPAASRVVPCVANADAAVTFDLTVARAAQQGFLDLSFDLQDVFCSAKYDCVDALAHDPTTGDRGPTLVTGLSCTAGIDEASAVTLAGAALCCTDAGGAPTCFSEGDALTTAVAAALRFAGVAQVANGHYIDLSWRLADAWLAANVGGVCRFQAVGWVDVGAAAAYAEGWPLVHWDVAITADTVDDITCAAGSAVTFGYSRRALCEDGVVAAPGVDVTSADLCAASDDDVGASCGASGPEHTVAFTAPTAGSYRMTAHGDGFEPVLYARDACVGAELACTAAAGSDPSIWLDLAEGETAWIFVAYPDAGCVSAAATLDLVATACGDGTLDPGAGEACDDGNTLDGDGCNGTCELEAPLGTTNLSSAPLLPASGRTCADMVGYSVVALSSLTATVAPAPTAECLAPGDEVLLLNAQGAAAGVANVGNYELLTVSDVTGTVVTFAAAKANFYGEAAGGDANIGVATGQQKVLLQRVPHYDALAVPSGATLSVTAWDGLTGGVFALRAGTLTLDGTISVANAGYRPGRGSTDNSSCSDSVATERGETIDGPARVTTQTAYGAPGGYAAVYDSSFWSTSDVNSAPGHATSGATGRSNTGRTPAAGGGVYGVADGTRLTFGSAQAGSYSCWNGSGPSLTGPGQTLGGGIIALYVGGTLTVGASGQVSANGFGVPTAARSGAGAGGYVRLEATTLDLGTGRVTARGGVNYSQYGTTFTASAGAGYVALLYRDALTGTTDPPGYAADLTP